MFGEQDFGTMQIESWPWVGGDVASIDILVLFMSLASISHAMQNKKLELLLAYAFTHPNTKFIATTSTPRTSQAYDCSSTRIAAVGAWPSDSLLRRGPFDSGAPTATTRALSISPTAPLPTRLCTTCHGSTAASSRRRGSLVARRGHCRGCGVRVFKVG